MRGLILAWAVGLGLMSWRDVQKYHKPPVPGRLLGASLVFAGLALLGEYEPARRVAVLTAWAFDLAVVFEIGPQALVSTAGFGHPTPAKESQLAPQPAQTTAFHVKPQPGG
jgi:hypothetical protein